MSSFGLATYADNLPTNPTIDTDATIYTTILGTGSKAAYQQVLPAVGAAMVGLWLTVYKTGASATDTSAVLDIATDPAGGTAYAVVIADVLVGNADDHNAGVGRGGGRMYFFPIDIPSGATVAVRGQTIRGTAQNASIIVRVAGGVTGTPYGAATFTTLGVTTVNGTTVAAGSGVTWSAWTTIVASTAADYQSLVLGIQGQPGTQTAFLRAAYQVQVGTGAAASEVQIGPTFDWFPHPEETSSGPFPITPIYRFIAAGTRLSVRSRATAGSHQSLDVALYAGSSS